MLSLSFLFVVYQISRTVRKPLFVQTQTTKRTVRTTPMLSGQALKDANEIVSKKPAPLSKEDEKAAKEVISGSKTLEPLSPEDEKEARKVLGM